jgi:hypothetical protein
MSACTYVGKYRKVDIVSKKNSINLSEGFYMIYPKDGHKKTYFTSSKVESKNSAKEFMKVFKKEFKHVGHLAVSPENMDLTAGFKSAKANGSKYLIDTKIIEWKDAFYMACRPSTTGGAGTQVLTKDAVDIQISIYDVNTKELLNQQRLVSNGCPIVFAFFPIGTNSPEGHLKKVLREWKKTL